MAAIVRRATIFARPRLRHARANCERCAGEEDEERDAEASAEGGRDLVGVDHGDDTDDRGEAEHDQRSDPE